MDKLAAQKILSLQDAMLADEEFRSLSAEHELLNARFLKTVDALTDEQKDAIFDYIGLLIEVYLRTLAFAVSQG